jgi:RNA polymerase sigma-70 factor (ECF subfamily)
LIAAGQRGDRDALDRLLRHHYQRIFAVCRRITGNDADAADASQEAMIAVVRGLPRFDGRSRFGTWVYRVATNAALDQVRRRNRRPVPLGQHPDGATPLAPPAAARAADDHVDDRVDIDTALLRLPVEFRAAVVLRDLCGLDYQEIADVLGVPPGTVRSRIARGRAGLVPLLAGNPEAVDDRRTRQQ